MFQEEEIKTFHEERGFGFIQIEGQSKDLFFMSQTFPIKIFRQGLGKN